MIRVPTTNEPLTLNYDERVCRPFNAVAMVSLNDKCTCDMSFQVHDSGSALTAEVDAVYATLTSRQRCHVKLLEGKV
jgi:hypothetical protein